MSLATWQVKILPVEQSQGCQPKLASEVDVNTDNVISMSGIALRLDNLIDKLHLPMTLFTQTL